MYERHLFNPAPRIGFAYDPFGNGKTAIRGGYGIFFEHANGNEANTESLENSPPLAFAVTQNFTTPVGYTGIGTSAGSTPVFPLTVISIPNKAQWPYIQQWHLDVQRQIPGNAVVTASYVGSKGTHDNAGVANGIGSASRPDLIGDPNSGFTQAPLSGHGPQFYNKAAFAPPRGLTFGTASRNILRNPNYFNFDMALLKHFAVTESTQFEFRAEAFNVFNRMEWGNIGGDSGSAGGSGNTAFPATTSCISRRHTIRAYCSWP